MEKASAKPPASLARALLRSPSDRRSHCSLLLHGVPGAAPGGPCFQRRHTLQGQIRQALGQGTCPFIPQRHGTKKWAACLACSLGIRARGLMRESDHSAHCMILVSLSEERERKKTWRSVFCYYFCFQFLVVLCGTQQ